jgi:hypothetical protein
MYLTPEKSKRLQAMLEKLNIDASQAPEKFQHWKAQVLGFLITHLDALNTLEQEIYKCSLGLKNPAAPHQVQPGETELWAEYKRRYQELTTPISVKQQEGGRSFGKPAKYDYLGYPDTKIVFIMKSPDRAVVETYYEYGIKRKEQFVLRRSDAGWKIDTKKYGFPDEDTWWKDSL